MRKRSYGLILILTAILFSLFSIRGTSFRSTTEAGIFMPFSRAQDSRDLTSASSDALLPFLGDSVLGYVDTETQRAFIEAYQERAAIDDRGWITYDRLATDLQLYEKNGYSKAISAYAYPWFKASWRVLVRADQMGIARMDEKSAVLWEKEFSTPITAIDASSKMIVIGLLDGSLHIFNTRGQAVFVASAGFREVQVIYGVAISQDSHYVVVLKGRSPQKIETYRQKETSYSKVSESLLAQESGLQATMAVADDNSHVIIARGDAVIYYNIKDNYNRNLQMNIGDRDYFDTDEKSQFFVLGATGASTIALLRAMTSQPRKTEVLILKQGMLERFAPEALSVSASGENLLIIYKDGVELLKGWQA